MFLEQQINPEDWRNLLLTVIIFHNISFYCTIDQIDAALVIRIKIKTSKSY